MIFVDINEEFQELVEEADSERDVSEYMPSNPSDQRAHLNSINIQGGSQVININQLARNHRSSRRNNSGN